MKESEIRSEYAQTLFGCFLASIVVWLCSIPILQIENGGLLWAVEAILLAVISFIISGVLENKNRNQAQKDGVYENDIPDNGPYYWDFY